MLFLFLVALAVLFALELPDVLSVINLTIISRTDRLTSLLPLVRITAVCFIRANRNAACNCGFPCRHVELLFALGNGRAFAVEVGEDVGFGVF